MAVPRQPGTLVLQGRADVRLHAERRPALLVLGSGRCRDDWRVELAFPGAGGRPGPRRSAVPSRVVGVWPQSGQVRVLSHGHRPLRAGAPARGGRRWATWVDARIEAPRPVLAGR